ncbi:MAG TPA: hypothetical protein VFU05_19240 [Cyclobacteriaceae bacterium]|nr:hypothetical protein [Cyclobacteriaceae bacterium]
MKIENLEVGNPVEELIDFSRIKQEKVRKLLRDNGLLSLSDLSKLKSYCYNKSDGLHYYTHTKSFLFKTDIATVWSAYKTVNPQETRNGGMVSFGMMYSRKQHAIMYPGDAYHGIEEGQILFLNLNLVGSALQLAVGHEITGVNDADKTIKICYLQNGASTGTQLIQLRETSDGQTAVTHDTWYRSGSIFRDKILYPGFHSKGLTEFHNNVMEKV